LAAGVIEATVDRMGRPAEELQVWLGPAIGPRHFEVGDEVRARFCAADTDAAAAFHKHGSGRWLADLALLARQRLERLGVGAVSSCGECTFADRDRFFSYRRDGVCGRMASLIWLR
jgi:copper oxidase (laccase) domain-containing protein